MSREERLEAIRNAVERLSEIYDAVQILATWLEPDGSTKAHQRGSGNWYARQQLAREFIEENRDNNLSEQIANKLEPPEDWKQ